MIAARLVRRLDDVAAALRPVRIDVSRPDLAARLGVAPDPWQGRVLRSGAREILLLCSRQSGKSTTAAVLGLHEALDRPGALVLVLSPGERQSKLLFRRIVAFYRALGEPVPADVDNRLSLELSNGSEIHALPGKEGTVRGFAGVSLLLVDEAARVPDDLYQAVRPMLAVSGGRLVLMSTPWGKRGFFWREWSDGGDAWHREKVTAADCPRIPPAWLAEERRRIGEWWFAQEYGCEFVEAQDQLYRDDDIDAAATPAVRPLFAAGVHDAA